MPSLPAALPEIVLGRSAIAENDWSAKVEATGSKMDTLRGRVSVRFQLLPRVDGRMRSVTMMDVVVASH